MQETVTIPRHADMTKHDIWQQKMQKMNRVKNSAGHSIPRSHGGDYGSLARYVIMRVAHAPRVSDPNMHHGACVRHVPWCMPWYLTRSFLWSRWRRKHCRYSGACSTRNFTYMASGPCRVCYTGPRTSTIRNTYVMGVRKEKNGRSKRPTTQNRWVRHSQHFSCQLRRLPWAVELIVPINTNDCVNEVGNWVESIVWVDRDHSLNDWSVNHGQRGAHIQQIISL